MKSYTTEDMKRFNYLTGETEAAYHEAALKLGMPDSAVQVLYAICNHGDSCPLGEICRLCGISKQTVNSALRRLEADGIVYLEVLSGKKKRMCLTQKGQELVEKTVVRLIEIENGILGSWSREELELYFELTKRFLTSFREKVRELERET